VVGLLATNPTPVRRAVSTHGVVEPVERTVGLVECRLGSFLGELLGEPLGDGLELVEEHAHVHRVHAEVTHAPVLAVELRTPLPVDRPFRCYRP